MADKFNLGLHRDALMKEVKKLKEAYYAFCESDAVQTDFAFGGPNLLAASEEGDENYMFGWDDDDEASISHKLRTWLEKAEVGLADEGVNAYAEKLYALNHGKASD